MKKNFLHRRFVVSFVLLLFSGACNVSTNAAFNSAKPLLRVFNFRAKHFFRDFQCTAWKNWKLNRKQFDFSGLFDDRKTIDTTFLILQKAFQLSQKTLVNWIPTRSAFSSSMLLIKMSTWNSIEWHSTHFTVLQYILLLFARNAVWSVCM